MLTNHNEKLKQIISTLIFNSVCNTAHKRQAYEIDIINRKVIMIERKLKGDISFM